MLPFVAILTKHNCEFETVLCVYGYILSMKMYRQKMEMLNENDRIRGKYKFEIPKQQNDFCIFISWNSTSI